MRLDHCVYTCLVQEGGDREEVRGLGPSCDVQTTVRACFYEAQSLCLHVLGVRFMNTSWRWLAAI